MVMSSVVFVLLTVLTPVRSQDQSIYGKMNRYTVPIDNKEVGQIYNKCFSGTGFTTCLPELFDDDAVIRSQLPAYRDLSILYGAAYCLNCCGRPPDDIDIWDLTCLVDATTIFSSNMYGMEFRIAKNRYEGDSDYVVCPIPRKACEYSADGKTTLNCDGLATDTTYFKGYTLRIIVEKYSSNFVYWNGVTSCDVESIEDDTPFQIGEYFTEKIIMVHKPVFRIGYQGDIVVIVLPLLGLFFIVYCVLYFCRRRHCIYCFKKLVFSTKMCYICQFVGAQEPDPFLLKALEEKGEYLQGQLPERFPGSTKLLQKVDCICDRIKSIFCFWNKKIEPMTYVELTQQRNEQVTKALADGFLVLDSNGYKWGTSEQPTKRELRKKKVAKMVLRMPPLNPNLLRHHPDAIYHGTGHHDPVYKEKHKELIRGELCDENNQPIPAKVEIMVLKFEEEEKQAELARREERRRIDEEIEARMKAGEDLR